ncbi:hypothetical protein G647_01964 [Cladophialophora carrionii CBS 160.54]|uniref:Uncharacterized protein n=1 Tax=Cladophialophora carrionii CBS 160.54 TaxID=1279043 RepID=V9DS87_9EURO|nr:uncharacterized protein G647_01964 [Cladophialophora carrionii CBS 160.54]ETI29511.1 hypothetical protein G647_01964 [Cladophialophora carrionii CBS 160.54]
MVETRGTTRKGGKGGKGGKPEPLKSPTAEKINRDAITRLGPPGIKSPGGKKTTTKKGKPPTYPKDINDDLDKIFGGGNDDMQESIKKIVNEAKQNPQGSPSAGTRSKITIKLTVGEASAAKKKMEEEAAAAAAAAAKKKTAKEAAEAKKQANAASAAAKKKTKEEAAATKKREKEEAAAAKKKAKAEAAAAKKKGKPGVTKKAAKSKAPAKTAASTGKTRSRKNLAEPARTSPVPASPKANTASPEVKKNPPTNKEPANSKPTKRTRTDKATTTAPKESKKAATAKKQAGQGKAPAKTVAKPTGVTKTRLTRSSARDAPNKTGRQPSYELQRGFAPTESQRRMIGFAIRSREWFSELERDYGTEFMKEVLNDKRIPQVDFWNRAFRFLGATAVGRSKCLGKPYEA